MWNKIRRAACVARHTQGTQPIESLAACAATWALGMVYAAVHAQVTDGNFIVRLDIVGHHHGVSNLLLRKSWIRTIRVIGMTRGGQ